MLTYRLVVEQLENKDFSKSPCQVAVDVVVRGNNPEHLETVGKMVHKFLDSGPFYGSWVDQGTEREEYTVR